MILWIILLMLVVLIGFTARRVRRIGYNTTSVLLIALAWVVLGLLVLVWLV